jgi:hypothetical protein
MKYKIWPFVFILVWIVAGCQTSSVHNQPLLEAVVPVNVTQTALARSTACAGHFVEHRLDFATGIRIREINTYESNGAGLAVNDLDGDGDLDLVFASIDNTAAILWNEGDLNFRSEALPTRFTRGVATVDVDGDGWLDLVFTHRGLAPPSFWRNQGPTAEVRFLQQPLHGVEHYAYAMGWADLTGDGALDLVTGSYNVELQQHGISAEAMAAKAGVVLYEQRGAGFVALPLEQQAEALAIGLIDLNRDWQPDIWVANDFVLQDQIWLRAEETWVRSQPFAETSHSTMSIDWGDIDNRGTMALFTTDMNPYNISTVNLAGWLPVINKLEQPRGPKDPQRMVNVLQVATSNQGWRNEAGRRGIEATGWSWAGKFGDLDNDGLLDLYVVNGMIAENLFAHLPNGELVEENQAFRNLGQGEFTPIPAWRLNATTSGRGMVMADLDDDGDLDIVVNNLRASAQLFENQLCGGAGVVVELRWPGQPNHFAIGAQIALDAGDVTYTRDVRATSGYLSGDAVRVHFGIPTGSALRQLRIRWPDGVISYVERPAPQTRLEVTR